MYKRIGRFRENVTIYNKFTLSASRITRITAFRYGILSLLLQQIKQLSDVRYIQLY